MEIHNSGQAMVRQVFRLPMMHFAAVERSPALWTAVLCWASLGFIWGVAARIWMRWRGLAFADRQRLTSGGSAR